MNDSDAAIGSQVLGEISRGGLVRIDEEEPIAIVWSANASEQLGALVKRIAAGRWRQKPPAETGWYWFQALPGWKPPIKGLLLRPDTPPAILIVGENRKGELACNFPHGTLKVTEMYGYWCGPIRAPQ